MLVPVQSRFRCCSNQAGLWYTYVHAFLIYRSVAKICRYLPSLLCGILFCPEKYLHPTQRAKPTDTWYPVTRNAKTQGTQRHFCVSKHRLLPTDSAWLTIDGWQRGLDMLDNKLGEEGSCTKSHGRRFPVPLTTRARIAGTQFVGTQPSVQLKEAELGFPS